MNRAITVTDVPALTGLPIKINIDAQGRTKRSSVRCVKIVIEKRESD